MKINWFGLMMKLKNMPIAYFIFCLCLIIDGRWICAQASIVHKKRPLTASNGLGGQNYIKYFQIISTPGILSVLFIFLIFRFISAFFEKIDQTRPQMTSYDIKIQNWTCLVHFWRNFRRGLWNTFFQYLHWFLRERGTKKLDRQTVFRFIYIDIGNHICKFQEVCKKNFINA